MVVGWYRKTEIWRKSTSCSTNPVINQVVPENLTKSWKNKLSYLDDEWCALLSWPTFVEKQGCLTHCSPRKSHCKDGERDQSGLQDLKMATTVRHWNKKNQTSEIPDRKLQCEVHYSRIAIYILHLLASLIVPHSSVHNQWKMSLVGVSTVSTWTYVRTWWMLPSPWVPRMSSYLQLCNCWSVGNALMLRFVVWCHVMGCWGVVEGDDISR